MNSIEPRRVSHPAEVEPLALTVEDIAHRLAQIAAVAHDDEVAHGMVDHLHAFVLQAVAAGHPEARDLAAAALRTDDIDFARWCA